MSKLMKVSGVVQVTPATKATDYLLNFLKFLEGTGYVKSVQVEDVHNRLTWVMKEGQDNAEND